jgi:hypothetical protein
MLASKMGGMSKRRRRLAGKLAVFRKNFGKKEREEGPGRARDGRFDHKFDKKLRRMDPEEFDALQSGDGLDEAEGASG